MWNDTAVWNDLKRRLRRYVARNRRRPVLRKIAQYCRTYLSYYENNDYDIDVNGERRVLERLHGKGLEVFFDVGAHSGDWSALVLELYPAAFVHSFEIVPETAAKLRRRLSGSTRVTVNAFGLSDGAGQVSVRTFEGRSDLATVYDYPNQAGRREIEACRVVRGDQYACEHGIDRIDFLKIDVEGGERRVLDGFSRMLAAGEIAVAQFEYGPVNIMARVLLRDLYDLFSSHGYVVGKIYPTYVDFRAYEPADEDFRGPNFLAVHCRRDDILARLQRDM